MDVHFGPWARSEPSLKIIHWPQTHHEAVKWNASGWVRCLVLRVLSPFIQWSRKRFGLVKSQIFLKSGLIKSFGFCLQNNLVSKILDSVSNKLLCLKSLEFGLVQKCVQHIWTQSSWCRDFQDHQSPPSSWCHQGELSEDATLDLLPQGKAHAEWSNLSQYIKVHHHHNRLKQLSSNNPNVSLSVGMIVAKVVICVQSTLGERTRRDFKFSFADDITISTHPPTWQW